MNTGFFVVVLPKKYRSWLKSFLIRYNLLDFDLLSQSIQSLCDFALVLIPTIGIMGDNKKYYFIKTGINPLFTRVY